MITAIYIITKLEDFTLDSFLNIKKKKNEIKPSYNYVENFMYPYYDISRGITTKRRNLQNI